MDEQRNLQNETEQEQDQQEDALDETTERPQTMFDREADQAAEAEMIRLNRKRAAILGLAAGGVMSLIIVICAGLIYLLGTS